MNRISSASPHECEVFGDVRPAATMVVVAELVRPEWRVEIEAEALIGDETDWHHPPRCRRSRFRRVRPERIGLQARQTGR
jgi:hypothetical protein